MSVTKQTKQAYRRTEPKGAKTSAPRRPSPEEKMAGRASVYENLTIVRDEYRRIPWFI